MTTGASLAGVLLEDTWEATDVMEECTRTGRPCQELTVEQLDAYDPREFMKHVFMCNTEIVQKKLQAVGLSSKVPATYPPELGNMFHRTMETKRLDLISTADLPLFVKPTSNNKAFDGCVVKSAEKLQDIIEEVGGGEKGAALEVFTAEVVSFKAEYRLFIGGFKCYGLGQINEAEPVGPPPDELVQQIVALVGDRFWVVDVGYLSKQDGAPEWAVVEVNPPFSMDDHGLAIEPYVQYCTDAAAWIRG
mmetsp:Transcript_40113/g.93154  ORF Transcript_40113/g.93154 Transcript_40113/m.93154 type:complete len:248 (+) Transcript_40113:48-791(+)|eukprot:CAMPEP_0171091010 /NCGR_PEP_ID=MMETSP0766_2-20121228/32186_1 /TAXON_ID=439317 /ORGANISM="Gambierdiscus australes, Strain CAWD 149" /LENGTH=247 /DNA_ID=CAMNT_0011549063 /DNA_START=38 /DNA_END=781 /DNA_ORIENTATION=-